MNYFIFRNCLSQSEAKLIAMKSPDSRIPQERSPSLNLLLRFQRLLIAQIYSHSQDSNLYMGKYPIIFNKQSSYNIQTLFYILENGFNKSDEMCWVFMAFGVQEKLCLISWENDNFINIESFLFFFM